MDNYDEQLTPELVDEISERLLHTPSVEMSESSALTRTVYNLRALYEEEQQLEEIWKRLVAQQESPAGRQSTDSRGKFIQTEDGYVTLPVNSTASITSHLRRPQRSGLSFWKTLTGGLVAALVLVGLFICLLPMSARFSSSPPQPQAPGPSPKVHCTFVANQAQEGPPEKTLSWSATNELALDFGSLKAYDAPTCQYKATYSPQEQTLSAVWSPDGRYLLTSGSVAHILDANTGTIITTFQPDWSENSPYNSVFPSAWSPDGKIVASAVTQIESDNKIALNIQIWDANSGKLLYTLDPPEPFLGQGTVELAWSPNGKYLAASFFADEKLVIWNIESKTPVHTFDHVVAGLIWSPDSQYVAAITRTQPTDQEGQVNVWSIITGKITFSYTPQKGSDVLVQAWSPDGKYIALAGVDSDSYQFGYIRLWDVQANKVYTIGDFQDTNQAKQPFGLVWSPQGSMLAIAYFSGGANSATCLVKVWEVN